MLKVDETGSRESWIGSATTVGSASTTKDGETSALGNFTIKETKS